LKHGEWDLNIRGTGKTVQGLVSIAIVKSTIVEFQEKNSVFGPNKYTLFNNDFYR